jgi:hypothetical protein
VRSYLRPAFLDTDRDLDEPGGIVGATLANCVERALQLQVEAGVHAACLV